MSGVDCKALDTRPKETAPFFVLIRVYQHPFSEKKATVFVKSGEYFRSQGGLISEWGKNWVPVYADSVDDARIRAHASVGTRCPKFHLNQGDS